MLVRRHGRFDACEDALLAAALPWPTGGVPESPRAWLVTVALLFLCCRESLSAPSQIAPALRAVGGLSTGEIASAFLVPEATMARSCPCSI